VGESKMCCLVSSHTVTPCDPPMLFALPFSDISRPSASLPCEAGYCFLRGRSQPLEVSRPQDRSPPPALFFKERRCSIVRETWSRGPFFRPFDGGQILSTDVLSFPVKREKFLSFSLHVASFSQQGTSATILAPQCWIFSSSVVLVEPRLKGPECFVLLFPRSWRCFPRAHSSRFLGRPSPVSLSRRSDDPFPPPVPFGEIELLPPCFS